MVGAPDGKKQASNLLHFFSLQQFGHYVVLSSGSLAVLVVFTDNVSLKLGRRTSSGL